jgi:hypothetical protein
MTNNGSSLQNQMDLMQYLLDKRTYLKNEAGIGRYIWYKTID